MEFFNSAIEVLQTLVVALGAGLGVCGAINLLEGYGTITPAAMLMYGREAQSKTRISQPCHYSEVRGNAIEKIHSCMLYLISI